LEKLEICLEIWQKQIRGDQKLPICFPKKLFIGKNLTISDGLVQSALLAGGLQKIMGNLGVPPRAQKVTDIGIFCSPK
jgi:hypothetical protein